MRGFVTLNPMPHHSFGFANFHPLTATWYFSLRSNHQPPTNDIFSEQISINHQPVSFIA
jgi:hypothetical protein